MITPKTEVSKKEGSIKTTTVLHSKDTGNFLFQQCDTFSLSRFNVVAMDPQQAIEVAIKILKMQGIIPQATTIEELETLATYKAETLKEMIRRHEARKG